jgi:hypothetical protein
MNKLKKHPALLSAFLIAEAVILSPLAKAQAPVRSDNLILSYTEIRAGECSATDPNIGIVTSSTPPGSLLYTVFCDPVVAPDGHQLTLGEFQAARVRSSVKCTGAGTLSVLHFSGLEPKGTYTVWLFWGKNSAGDFTAIGALGTTVPIENFFTTSEAGEGQLSVTTPAETLSVFGTVGPCLLNAPFELHLVYHINGQTYGPVPGPAQTWITVGILLFP